VKLGLPDVGSTPVKVVSEAVMDITIPFALTWGAILTGVTVGVHAYNQKKEAAEKKLVDADSPAEETK